MNDGDPSLDPELIALAERLERDRPLPRPGFRGDLGRRLDELAARRGVSPQRLRLWIATNASSGTALLALAAAGVVGIGPLSS